MVERVYLPRNYAKIIFDLVEPGGTAIVSTRYHGHLESSALTVTGVIDSYFTALWDHGQVKFWSSQTLTALLLEAGLESVRFRRVVF